MKNYSLLLFPLLACLLRVGLTVPCDERVVKNIKKLWEKNGIPANFVNRKVLLSPDCVVKTSKNYFKNQDEISEVVTSWEGSSSNATASSVFYYTNMTSSPAQILNLREVEGQTITFVGDVHRYHIPITIPNCEEVTAFYKCQGEPKDLTLEKNRPEGIITVNKGWRKECVKNAKKQLKSIGVKVEVSVKVRCRENTGDRCNV